MIQTSKRKIIIIIGIISFIMTALILLWAIPFSYEVNFAVQAFMVSGTDTEESIVEIKIKGTYTKHFLREDDFQGSFIIDEFGITQRQNSTVDVKVGRQTDVNLIYRVYNGSQLESYPFGILFADKDFKSFIVVPYTEYTDNSEYDGKIGSVDINSEALTIICYPAQTRSDAIEMANFKLKSFDKYLDE